MLIENAILAKARWYAEATTALKGTEPQRAHLEW